jgi:hypothetical protein
MPFLRKSLAIYFVTEHQMLLDTFLYPTPQRNIDKFMTKQQKATNQEVLMVRKEKRGKQVRITDKTYNELAKLGDLTEDWEDVIARILKHYLSCPNVRQEDKEHKKAK